MTFNELRVKMDVFDAIRCSHEDVRSRNSEFHAYVARRQVVLNDMRHLIPRLGDFEATAMKWLFSSKGPHSAERHVALLYIDYMADPESLNYLLYMLMHEEGGNPQFIILNTLDRLFQNLDWEQVSVLQHGVEMYRAKLAKPGSDRDCMCERLCRNAALVLAAGESEFRKCHRFQSGAIGVQHSGTTRFQRLYDETKRMEVTEDTLRDCLPPSAYEVFQSYDKRLSLQQRALRLWTSDVCYREMNRDIILDRRSLRQWMPLICLIIQQMKAEPVEHELHTTRGSKLTLDELQATYSEGAEVALSMFVASSLDSDIAASFTGHGVKVNFIIPAGCQFATVVRVSEFEEAEVLIAPFTLVKCVSRSVSEVTLEVQNASLLSHAGTGLA